MNCERLTTCPGGKEYTSYEGATKAGLTWYNLTDCAAEIVRCEAFVGDYHYHLKKFDTTGDVLPWDTKFPSGAPTKKVTPSSVMAVRATEVMTAPCVTGKRGYVTEAYAEAALLLANQAKRTLHQGRRKENRVYECDLCDGWHLSSQPKHVPAEQTP